MVETMIAEMRSVQAVGPSIIAIVMIKAVGAEMITPITYHTNKIRFKKKIISRFEQVNTNQLLQRQRGSSF